MMEIEAKFHVDDAETFLQLQQVSSLLDCNVTYVKTKEITDTYLDTKERAILQNGYACRRRAEDEGVRIALKSLGQVSGAIHHREELELALSEDMPPIEWPHSPVRSTVLEITNQQVLVPLVTLNQSRIVYQIERNGHALAEMSLDSVVLAYKDQVCANYELELELHKESEEAWLARLADHFEQKWHLTPAINSKFERALILIDRIDAGEDLSCLDPTQLESLLPTQHRQVLEHIAANAGEMYRRRAQALLKLDEGKTQVQTSQQVNLSARRVRHWLQVYRQQGLAVFPTNLLQKTQAALSQEITTRIESVTTAPTTSESGNSISVEAAPAADTNADPPKSNAGKTALVGLTPDDPIEEAARKTFWFHFQQMLANEEGTRQGEDIEALHDMRVAVRRMRVALKLFEPHLNAEMLRSFRRGLRRTGRVLGQVRDLDVFAEKTDAYLADKPAAQRPDLSPLMEAWTAAHSEARTAMLTYLDSKRYRRFKNDTTQLLQNEARFGLPHFNAKGEAQPYRLRHMVPILIYQRLAEVRAYDEWVRKPDVPIDRLHRLRIACKGLRYTLEYFAEILPPKHTKIIGKVKYLQDHLGDLQDAAVASDLLRHYLAWGTWAGDVAPPNNPMQSLIAPGVAFYLAERQQEMQTLCETFPEAWQAFNTRKLRQQIANLVTWLK